MEALVSSRNNLTLRRIDVGSGDTPVAQQFRIRSVPHLLLFEDGQQVAEGTRAVLARLTE